VAEYRWFGGLHRGCSLEEQGHFDQRWQQSLEKSGGLPFYFFTGKKSQELLLL